MAVCGLGQNDDCVQVIRNTKTVHVPCTVNKYEKYTEKVPRQVTEQVPRTVQYTDFESRQKQVPYTDYRSERRTRMETQKYQVPVTTTCTRMVPVTKKVPKTVYVDFTTQVPKSYTKTSMQTKERQVPVPYYVNVPETKYRTVTEQVPVQKRKVEMDTVVKTVYDTQVRRRCVPVTKIVTRSIPVYNVVAKPAPTISLDVGAGSGTSDGSSGYKLTDGDEGDQVDHTDDTFDRAVNITQEQPSSGEYHNGQAFGTVTNNGGFVSSVGNAAAYGVTTGNIESSGTDIRGDARTFGNIVYGGGFADADRYQNESVDFGNSANYGTASYGLSNGINYGTTASFGQVRNGAANRISYPVNSGLANCTSYQMS